MKWIKTKRSLPNKYDTVLVCSVDNRVTTSYLGYSCDDKDELMWQFECCEKIISDCPYWMPMPQPPKI